MDNSNRHIVHKINTNVNCNIVNLQKVNDCNLSESIKSAIDELSREFDAIGHNQMLSFSTISVDVDLSSNHLYSLKDSIKDALKDKILEAKTDDDLKETNASTMKAKHFTPIEVLLIFFKSGKLPWTVKKLPLEFGEYVEGNVRESFFPSLMVELRENPKAIVRMVNQLSENKVLELLGLLVNQQFSKVAGKLMATIKSSSKKYSKIYDIGFRLNMILKKSIFDCLVKMKKDTASEDRIWKATIDILIKDALDKYPDLDLIVFEESILETNEQQLITTLDLIREINISGGHSTSIFEPKNLDNSNHTDKDDLVNIDAYLNGDNNKETDQNRSNNSYPAKSNSGNKPKSTIQVFNAGIVLIHPFLSKFFEKVGLMNKGVFSSVECQQRAVCLLHYIATGEVEFKEQNLHFQKFICNYNDDNGIPKDLPISQYEKDEVEKLLNAVLEHWGSLKGVTIHGLRGNFLIRNGVLQHDGNEIIIHIENKTADILLKQLPWTLNFAKWSWHPNLLTIKWS